MTRDTDTSSNQVSCRTGALLCGAFPALWAVSPFTSTSANDLAILHKAWTRALQYGDQGVACRAGVSTIDEHADPGDGLHAR